MNSRRILAVGSVALDSVKTPFGKVTDALGGSATFFSASARFFSPVSIVAVVGCDFPPNYLNLIKKLGVDTHDLRTVPGKTFRWKGFYGYNLNDAHTLKTELNVFQDFRPVVSEENRECAYVFLANIDPDLQQSVLAQVRRPRLTACDTMNYWIQNKKKSLRALLKKVDLFLCNDNEARQLARERNLIQCARWILSRGPRLLVIKKGEHGVACFSKNFLFIAPAYPLENVSDPTGAGDSFAGGFIGYLARSGRFNESVVRKAVIYGSVLASYNVERFSLNRLIRLKRSEIERRYRRFGRLTKF
ncbi:MAG: sugar kinase [Candidatus Omnitrophica bacterium CG07_land_8_20_14_0_80_50_8]|nr:MAG: sugar kinase [Candidatus Omnitrophica bacterium CG1_02_49_16]PIU39872.1 MAG: sugar kinase [Candidatus Omnitrophica bacterium CG07_land_8_20_14_0_80_50_8]